MDGTIFAEKPPRRLMQIKPGPPAILAPDQRGDPGMADRTIFEKLMAGELPCAKVCEDEQVFAFMDAGQVNPGDVIVATRKPYETLLDADGAAGWQTVPHLHAHVLPRHADDGVGLTWPRKNPPMEELRALAARIELA